jgi:hypothetical protein
MPAVPPRPNSPPSQNGSTSWVEARIPDRGRVRRARSIFAIQAPAALASGRLGRLARRGSIAGKIAAHGATILFIAVTSVLFFDGVSKIFPFVYASRSPLP